MTNATVTNNADVQLARDLREIAARAARVGGELALSHFCGSLNVELKNDRSEVSEADLATQRAVVAEIRNARPNDEFFAEEADDELARIEVDPATASGVTWIIDPIDGTRNFVREIRSFACAIAAMKDGRPIAAATYDAAHDTLYAADLSRFYIGDRPVSAEREDRHEGYSPRPVVAVPSTFDEPGKRFLTNNVNEIVLRNFGAAALHLAYVAAGKIDASLLCDGCLWDIAGGCLMVEQMGGHVSDYAGNPLFPIDLAHYPRTAIPCVASLNSNLHSHMITALTAK